MSKALILASSLLLASPASGNNPVPSYSPANTIIIFDINDVLLAHEADETIEKPLVPGILTLAQELHGAGYTLHIASNMKEKNFLLYSALYPSLFGLFEKALYRQTADQHRALKKPDPLFFHRYLNEYTDPAKSYYIFIDDKQKNVASAEQLGFVGIQFIDAPQLRSTLTSMGIMAITP